MYQPGTRNWRVLPRMPGSLGLFPSGTTKTTVPQPSTVCTGEWLLSRNIHIWCISAELRVLSFPFPSISHSLGERRRCAFNSAVQMIALMPGVRQYLKQLCSRCDINEAPLPLHRALYKQLEELAVALVAHKPTTLETLLKALDKSPDLCNMAQRVG